MGAADYRSTAFGKTAQAAFSAAVEQAQHEHGHGGYTGTIAEKNGYGFIQVDLPKGVAMDAFINLLHDAEEFGYLDYERERLRDHERFGKGKRKTYGGRTLKQAQAAYEKEKRKADRFWSRLAKKPGLAEAVRKYGPAFQDKWGPALCFGPLTGKAKTSRLPYAVGARAVHEDGGWKYRAPRGQKMYHFCGYASE